MGRFRGLLVPAIKIRIMNGKKTVDVENVSFKRLLKDQGYFVFKATISSAKSLYSIFEKADRLKSWPYVRLDIDVDYEREYRSIGQNKLYRALLTILSLEISGEYGWEDDVHEMMLGKYSPKIWSPIRKINIPKRSKDMDKKEFAFLIEGVFYEIAMQGLNISSQADIKNYWYEFQKNRFEDGVDLIYKQETIEEYRKRHPFCEACLKPLRYETELYCGNIAHIISRGSGGTDDSSNILHLCNHCHMGIQHQNGWSELFDRFPESKVKEKYEIAYSKNGKSNES